MSKIEEARALLKELNVPSKQQADLCCYVLLAMADIKEDDSWSKATNEWIRIHDVLTFTKTTIMLHMLKTVERHSANRLCTISVMPLLLKITVRRPIVRIIVIG